MQATIEIEKLIFGGQGLGRFEGKPVFVNFVLPGETVIVEIIKRRRKYLEAKLIKVVNSSSDRMDPPCSYFGQCGGCQWQHIRYETQCHWKESILKETLQRTAQIPKPKILPTIPSPKTLGWRRRVVFHGDEEGKVGFYKPNSHRVVDIEQCSIAEEQVNEELQKIRSQKERQKNNYAVGGEAFAQVNPLQNENLKKLLKEWATPLPHQTILELFCGSGNLTEALIPLTKNIIAVDSEATAIDAAKEKWEEIEFICSDAVRFYAKHTPKDPLDLLILDPPRDGAGGIIEGVIKTKPKNILYISCNPASLARDLKFLKDFASYELAQSQPIDMFPHSYHIESLSWIKQSLK